MRNLNKVQEIWNQLKKEKISVNSEYVQDLLQETKGKVYGSNDYWNAIKKVQKWHSLNCELEN
jgi:ADP-glucose pyrophosphorylase